MVKHVIKMHALYIVAKDLSEELLEVLQELSLFHCRDFHPFLAEETVPQW
jgi:hypothetical protein